MNPDLEDPNNHVPAVSADDDWSDLDVEGVPDAQLPPRRTDGSRLTREEKGLSGVRSFESESPVSVGSSDDPRHYADEQGLKKAYQDRVKSSLSLNIHHERAFVEKDPFHAAHVIEDDELNLESAKNRVWTAGLSSPLIEDRDHWGKRRRKSSSKWMIHTALGVILLVTLAIMIQFTGEQDATSRDQINRGDTASAAAVKNVVEDLGELGWLANANQEAVRIYANYARAKSVDDFLESIYLSEHNAAMVSGFWSPIGAREGWNPADKSSWETHRSGNVIYAELRGSNHDFSRFHAFFRYENAALKMDWKATAGYGTALFSDLKNGMGDASEIRAWISPSDFYTQKLPENRYRCFLIASPNKDTTIWAYTEIGSEIDNKILALFMISPITREYQTEVGVILSLGRGDQDILPRQWMIDGLVAANWLDQSAP